jgi:thiosulfate reductase cytochrome b subunit
MDGNATYQALRRFSGLGLAVWHTLAMSTAWFHTVAAFLLTMCVLFFALGNYFGYVMTQELRGRLPDSDRSWFRVWCLSPFSHRKYCPDSKTWKKLLTCELGMVVCGFLGFFFWMH